MDEPKFEELCQKVIDLEQVLLKNIYIPIKHLELLLHYHTIMAQNCYLQYARVDFHKEMRHNQIFNVNPN